MKKVLQFLAADYSRSRIENVTCWMLPLIVAVPVFVAAVSL